MSKKIITDADIRNYVLSDAEELQLQAYVQAMGGQDIAWSKEIPALRDFLSTPSAQILMPKVTLGAMREIAEPMYIASQFFQKIRLKHGTSMLFPSIGTIARAYDVAEGQEINFGVSAA